MNLPFDDGNIQQLIDAVGVGVAMYDRTGRFVYVNRTYAEMLGTDRETLSGKAIWEINPQFDESAFEGYWNSFGPGETRFAETVHEYEGTAVQVGTATTQTTVDGTVYHIGTIRDISLRKRRERQLEQLNAVTTDLIEAKTRDEIAQLTAGTVDRILDCQRISVWFVEGDQLRPRSVMVHNGLPSPVACTTGSDTPVAEAFRRGETVVDERPADDEPCDSQPRIRSVVAIPLGEDGVLTVETTDPDGCGQTDQYLASLIASNSETALERLENEQHLERQNERLEAFYDVITHDIPNHLNVAATRLDLTLHTEDMEHLDYVDTAHERIASVINDMRTLVEQGQQLTTPEQVWLSDIVWSCWQSATGSDSRMSLELVDDRQVMADPSRLKQLFENLFWNSVEHGSTSSRVPPDDSVEHGSTSSRTQSDDSVEHGGDTVRVGSLDNGFYVEDNGPGIPEAERDDVLTPGYTTGAGNSGFGLAIVKEIARAHGWRLEITDGTDGGARFEFTEVATDD